MSDIHCSQRGKKAAIEVTKEKGEEMGEDQGCVRIQGAAAAGNNMHIGTGTMYIYINAYEGREPTCI